MFEAIDLAVLSGLGRRYTHPGRYVYLPFRGHWPYRLRSNNGSCSRTNDWQLSINPRRRIPAFIPHAIKASLCVTVLPSGINSITRHLVDTSAAAPDTGRQPVPDCAHFCPLAWLVCSVAWECGISTEPTDLIATGSREALGLYGRQDAIVTTTIAIRAVAGQLLGRHAQPCPTRPSVRNCCSWFIKWAGFSSLSWREKFDDPIWSV